MSDATDHIVSRGIRVPQDANIITPRVAKKLRKEFYESPEIGGLSKFVKPSDRILELGAGIGYISTYLAKFIHVSAITVIEANPVLCDFIAKIHAANEVSGAHILNGVALPDSGDLPAGGTLPFYVTSPFWSSSLTARNDDDAKVIDVPAFRLSDIISEARPTVIICDIEGGEVDLFDAVDLTGVKYVYMELHTRVTGGRGIVKVFDSMHRHGFFYHQRVSGDGVVLFERL